MMMNEVEIHIRKLNLNLRGGRKWHDKRRSKRFYWVAMAILVLLPSAALCGLGELLVRFGWLLYK